MFHTEPDGGGTSGGTGRRRRNTKQDRALYQPGKGLGGGSRGSPAPSTGSNQGMSISESKKNLPIITTQT